MIRRQEVEALLKGAEQANGSLPHVDAPELAALCRAWLAMEDAPVTELEWGDFSRGLFIDDPRMSAFEWEQHLAGQRVRIVPVEGDQNEYKKRIPPHPAARTGGESPSSAEE